jgi:hypothetical protein
VNLKILSKKLWSKKADLNVSTYGSIERGDTDVNFHNLTDIVEVLGVNKEVIITMSVDISIQTLHNTNGNGVSCTKGETHITNGERELFDKIIKDEEIAFFEGVDERAYGSTGGEINILANFQKPLKSRPIEFLLCENKIQNTNLRSYTNQLNFDMNNYKTLINTAISEITAISADLAVFLVINRKGRTDLTKDYKNFTLYAEFFSDEEVNDIVSNLKEFVSLVDVSNGEEEFIQKIANGHFRSVSKKHKIVYNSTGSGIRNLQKLNAGYCVASLSLIEVLTIP